MMLSEEMQASDEYQRFIHVRIRPVWDYIAGVREFCRAFCETTFPDRNVSDRVRLVAQELLENAIKYSVDGEISEVELMIHSDHSRLRLTVRSRPQPGRLEDLRKELAIVYETPPKDAYVAALQRAANLPSGASRLGLARMRYEGQVDLSVEEEGEWISMEAQGRP